MSLQIIVSNWIHHTFNNLNVMRFNIIKFIYNKKICSRKSTFWCVFCVKRHGCYDSSVLFPATEEKLISGFNAARASASYLIPIGGPSTS